MKHWCVAISLYRVYRILCSTRLISTHQYVIYEHLYVIPAPKIQHRVLWPVGHPRMDHPVPPSQFARNYTHLVILAVSALRAALQICMRGVD